MMYLVKNARVIAPEDLGTKDLLTGGGRVLAIGDKLQIPEGVDVSILDAKDLTVIPGLIDSHVHVAGAGGEGGPASRTPELKLSYLMDAGVTTVIGCMGTDGMTRSLESVLMKVKSIRAQGFSAWMYTGSYQVPTPTFFGDPGKDIALIEEVIGVGEIAISDHRSSCPDTGELARLAGHARVGGMLGGKSGIVNVHMGDARDPFRPLYQVAETTQIRLTQFLPTHCNRNAWIFEDAIQYGKHGYLDITASSWEYFPEDEIKPSRAIKTWLESGVPLKHITMSSDGCGSLPKFDEQGKLLALEMGLPSSVFKELSDTVLKEGIPLVDAVRIVSTNVAEILRLPGKGRIRAGYDADLVFIDRDFSIRHMMSKGKLVVEDTRQLVLGAYENL